MKTGYPPFEGGRQSKKDLWLRGEQKMIPIGKYLSTAKVAFDMAPIVCTVSTVYYIKVELTCR